VLLTGVDNHQSCPGIAEELAFAEEQLFGALGGRDPKALPNIARWRSAFADAGWTPSKYPSSIEAIVKRVARGQGLPRINPLVDLGNAVSLRTLCPIGAHDVDSLGGESLTVRPSRDGDRFSPMGDAALEAPEPGEIVYAAGSTVRTRRWVWRQSREALITPDTTTAFFPIDGFAPESLESVHEAVTRLKTIAGEAFGCEILSGAASAEAPEFFA